MPNKQTSYPLVVFVYKRPDSTLEILKRAKAAGINKIYLFADGPKLEADKPLTQEVKKEVNHFIYDNLHINFVTTFHRKNFGLQQNIVTGLKKVFANEAAAIILEDDCLPHPDFFPFMRRMLSSYANDHHVMSVSGTSVGNFTQTSYSFSRYQLCWGWASWQRAWQLYRPQIVLSTVRNFDYTCLVSKWYWKHIFALVQQKIINTWDYQWTYSHFLNHGLAIIPSHNLVTNIGFDSAATHTKIRSRTAYRKTEGLELTQEQLLQAVENLSLTRAIEKSFYLTPLAILGLIRYLMLAKIQSKHV